jgi:serine protease
MLGGFLAVALGAALAVPGVSAAGAATLSHRTGPHALHPGTALPVPPLKPRPGNGAVHILAGNLINHGGPVQNAPRVFVDFWGWTSDQSGEQAYLTRFLSSVGGTSWLSIVNQYGAGSSGNLLAGTWSNSASVPRHPTDAQIQAQAVSAASHFGTGNSVNVQIVVATPTRHSTSGFGTQRCAYHGAVSADPNITYTNLPYITDAGASCGEDSVNGSGGTLDGVSIVEGHELAETITDPLLNAWYDSSGSEIGDKCAWINLHDITTSGGSFAVQPLWSNAVSGCAG